MLGHPVVLSGLQAVKVCAHVEGSTLASNATVGSVKDFMMLVIWQVDQKSKGRRSVSRVDQTRSRSSKNE